MKKIEFIKVEFNKVELFCFFELEMVHQIPYFRSKFGDIHIYIVEDLSEKLFLILS